MSSRVVILATLLSVTFATVVSADPDYDPLEDAETVSLDENTIAAISQFAESNRLGEPTILAAGPEDIKRLAREAKQAHREIAALVQSGDPEKVYDLVIQVGHFPKTSGSTGGQGRIRDFLRDDGERIPRVTEQDMAALVALGISRKLDDTEVDYLVIESRPSKFGGNIRSKIFLALHTDSAVLPCSVGPSVGYDSASDAKGMHLIAFGLATALGLDPTDFMRDNYTKNLQGYYSYRYFNTDLFEGLLEMGELTCPEQEDRMLERASVISEHLATAIQFSLRPEDLPW